MTLGDLAGRLEFLRIEYDARGRSGRYRVLRLMQELGEEFTPPALRAKLTADCPRRQAGRIYDQCRASFPDLSRMAER